MDARPQIQIPLTVADRLLEIAGWCTLITLWVFTLMYYPQTPEIIPIHFNAVGEADGFGSKKVVFFLPVIGTVLFGVLTWLHRFPHIFNYPVPITAENAPRQYRLAIRVIRYIKFVVALIFLLIVMKALGDIPMEGPLSGVWFLPFVLAMIFFPLAMYVALALRNR